MYPLSLYAFTWPEIQVRGSWPLYMIVFLVLVTLAAMAGIVTAYAKEAGRVWPGLRLLMAAVRMAVVAGVAFLLLRPVLVFERDTQRPRPIGILIDVSQSMDNKDPRPASADQWRVALAYGLTEANKPLPQEPLPTSLLIPERPKRIEIARAALNNPKIDLLKRLSQSAGPLDVFTFGARRTGKDWRDAKWLEELGATEPRTALVDAAFELLNRNDSDLPAALVLVTDGRDNASGRSLDDLARECARRQVPVYVYGVGSSAFGQLRVKDLNVPESIFVDDLVSVPVRYSVKGVKEGKAEIVLNYGGREVARKTVPVREGDNNREILTFMPTKEDAARKKAELSATVTITPAGGGETLSDSLVRPTQVIDKKLKVLVVDSLPRFDFKFLQRALLRDRRVEAKFYLTEGDKMAMRSPPPSPWAIELSRELNGSLNLDRDEFRKFLYDFDLLILGAVPNKYFSEEQQKVIKDFVTEGGGLIQIAGRSYGDSPSKQTAPAAWAGEWQSKHEKGGTQYVALRPPSPVGEVLPVEFEAVRTPIQDPRPPAPFVPVLGPAAARSPIVSLTDDPIDNAELWGKFGRQDRPTSEKQLKPLYWFYPVLKTKPAADVFLVHPGSETRTADNKPMPLLVGHFYGKGYVLWVGFDDTWRWRFNSADKLFGRFWSQAIYTAGMPRTIGTKLTQLSMDNPDPVRGGTGQVYARVFNENYKLMTAEEIDATLEKLDADPNDKDRSIPIKLHKIGGQDGEYLAAIPFNRVGRYKLTVDPKNKTPAELEYRVSLPPDDEMAPGGMDEEAMRKLCGATGGKFYREEDLHKLPQDVKPEAVSTHSRYEWIFWNWWSLVAIIGLLTIEWLLRKFNGLS